MRRLTKKLYTRMSKGNISMEISSQTEDICFPTVLLCNVDKIKEGSYFSYAHFQCYKLHCDGYFRLLFWPTLIYL